MDSAAADTGKAVHKNPKEKPSPPGSAPPPSPKRSVFTKPTIGEVKAYFAEKGLKSDPEHFYDHFESNGWKVSGKSAMKDWKAAARNWERNESTYGRSNQRKTIRSYRNSDYWTEDEQR